MDLIDHLKALASKIEKQCHLITTEEATKNAFVMPFLHALGYDVFNPMEVIPEFTADVGIKKGEKVDYAIKKDDAVIMLFECKTCGAPLDRNHASQLFRYFTVTDARIAVLTNGIEYQFYTDLDTPNKMDERPFMEFSLLDLNENLVPEIKKLAKAHFNLEATISAAEELKYTRGIRKVIEKEFTEPSEEFVKYLVSQIYSGRITQNVREHFTGIVKKAVQQYINDRINDRIKVALSDQNETPEPQALPVEAAETDERENRIETTQEEQEAYMIVKSIVRQVVEPERISPRDTITYFGILLDDNNRKPICRLHFNRSRKYIGLFDDKKVETRLPIQTVDDIFDHAEALQRTVRFYESGTWDAEPGTEAAAEEPAPTQQDPTPVDPVSSDAVPSAPAAAAQEPETSEAVQ